MSHAISEAMPLAILGVPNHIALIGVIIVVVIVAAAWWLVRGRK
jgi:hypothetical protein